MTTQEPPTRRGAAYPAMLLIAFSAVWVALAVAPRYRQDWLLENVLVLIAVPALVLGFRRFRFSHTAYTAVFAFLVLHEVGAHFTYSEVPYDHWIAWLTEHTTGSPFGWERNHYDRLVHFSYGLLITLPAFELIDAHVAPRRVWRFLLPWTFVLSHSLIYELIEWVAALVFGGELGMAYLGTQGDVWDAQKDMTLAALGASGSIMAIAASRPGARGAATASAVP